jgi:hypothetical protein
MVTMPRLKEQHHKGRNQTARGVHNNKAMGGESAGGGAVDLVSDLEKARRVDSSGMLRDLGKANNSSCFKSKQTVSTMRNK